MLAALALLTACRDVPTGRLHIEAVAPNAIDTDARDVLLRISGRFPSAMRISLQRGTPSRVRTEFDATAGSIQLTDVTFVDASTLEARLPEPPPPGTYPIVVTAPDGRSVTASNALRVQAATPSQACRGPPESCRNLPPRPRVSVSPTAARPGALVTLDATASVDDHDATEDLRFGWDWDGDGATDAYGSRLEHAFSGVGEHRPILAVEDTHGAVAYWQGPVVIAPPGQLLDVNTATDTVADDGQLSLREALQTAGDGNQPTTIHLQPGLEVQLESELAIEAAGVTLVGEPTTSITRVTPGRCLRVRADAVNLLWLRIQGCAGPGLVLAGAGNSVAHTSVRDGDGAAVVVTGTAATVGPRVSLTRNQGNGLVLLAGAAHRVLDSRVEAHGAAGIRIARTCASAQLKGNTLVDNRVGIWVHHAAATVVWHNTITQSSNAGLTYVTEGLGSGMAQDLRDNILHGNGTFGVSGSPTFDARSHNMFHANGSGAWRASEQLGAASVRAAPKMVSPERGDVRLWPDSPGIDAGVELGWDSNGPRAGNYNGVAPDIGAWESP